ncbi:MAG: hypothetical protein ABI910_23665, partial [Gemmatimonadota bacterium]
GRGAADIARAWGELQATGAGLVDSTADVTWWFRRTMVAAVLARSGLRDSAYAVLRASRAMRSTSDPNLLVQEAFVAAQLPDTSRVVELLGAYLRRVPSAAVPLAREPRFRALHGSRAFDSLFTVGSGARDSLYR